MKAIICIMIMLFVLSVNSKGQDSLSTVFMKTDTIASDTLSYLSEKAYENVPYLKWFGTSLFFPGITVLGSEVLPSDTLAGYEKRYNETYKKLYRKQRTEATIYGSVVGALMLLWWGVLIL